MVTDSKSHLQAPLGYQRNLLHKKKNHVNSRTSDALFQCKILAQPFLSIVQQLVFKAAASNSQSQETTKTDIDFTPLKH